MEEKDKVFNFFIRLNPWACNEVKRKKIKILEEAFVAIDRLVDRYDEGTEEKKKKSDKPKEKFLKEDEARIGYKPKKKKHLKCGMCECDHAMNNFPSRPKIGVVM